MSKPSLFCLLLAICTFWKPGVGQHVRRQATATETSTETHGFSASINEAINEEFVQVSQNTDELFEGDQGIRGGNEIGALPWYAVFQSATLCGASLIHGDILLTAAHCVDDNGLPEKVRVGSNDYFSGGTVTKVIDGVLHPGWTWRKPSDPDLAILVLKDFLSNQVAQLNTDSSTPTSSQSSLFAMGFGLVNDEQSSPSLIGAEIPFLDDCSSQSSTYEGSRHLCADARRVATCGGDSGSPIMLGRSSNLQVGINSFSDGGCSTQTIDVYTRVSYYQEWIKEQVCKLSAQPPQSCLSAISTLSPTRSTLSPTQSTLSPTRSPVAVPSTSPSAAPSASSSDAPTDKPTQAPTEFPTVSPTVPSDVTLDGSATTNATDASTTSPPSTPAPTASPTETPTTSPTGAPTTAPTEMTSAPSPKPTWPPPTTPPPTSTPATPKPATGIKGWLQNFLG